MIVSFTFPKVAQWAGLVFDIMFDTLARDNPRSVCITLVTETLAPLYVT